MSHPASKSTIKRANSGSPVFAPFPVMRAMAANALSTWKLQMSESLVPLFTERRGTKV